MPKSVNVWEFTAKILLSVSKQTLRLLNNIQTIDKNPFGDGLCMFCNIKWFKSSGAKDGILLFDCETLLQTNKLK